MTQEQKILDLFSKIEIIVSYNNQMELLDYIEEILTEEQKQQFKKLRKETINKEWNK